MKYLFAIFILLMLPGDDPPDSTKRDTVRIQQQQAIEITRGARATVDSLIRALEQKQDTTKKK